MVRRTPRVEDATLIAAPGVADGIVVGTPTWHSWLEQATTFAFASAQGSFTARKERSGRGGWYWKAYRKQAGRLHNVYLGKSSDLTLKRLNAVAQALDEAFAKHDTAGDLPTPQANNHLPRSPGGAPSEAVPPHQLLATKFHMPTARPNLLARPRLLEQLQYGLLGKLTLISAPAGFGKTTLLSAWRATAAGSAVPFAWVSLDAADSDPLRFWSYAITALNMLQPGVGRTALELLQSAQPLSIEAVLTPLLNALSTLTADAVLALDDYHTIEAPAIHSALAFLLDHLPPKLHLILTTRADPPLPLTRLRAQRQLTELRAADLRFTVEESAAFLTELMRLPLSAEDVAALEARTEGWIAGLQFAALAMHDRSDLSGFVQAFRGSNRFVVDYLAEEVLSRQPAHIQTFLMQTAILDRMCGPLCDAVLGIGDQGSGVGKAQPIPDHRPSIADSYSQLILEQLERANLFLVPLDDERHWYRYHHLFAEVLRQRLASGASGATVATLHRRASAWFERADLGVEAIQHALASRDWEQAARLIEQYAWVVMFRGQIHTMLEWFRTLPDAVMRVRPTLYVLHAVMLMHTKQLDSAEAQLREAVACLLPTTSEEQRRLVQGMVHTTHSTIGFYQGDLPACIEHAQQALDLLPETASIPHTAASGFAALAFLVSGDVRPALERQLADAASVARAADNRFVVLRALVLRAKLQALQGRLRLAAATLRQAAQVAPEAGGVQRLIGSEGYYFGLGDIYREWNDFEAAEPLLRTGMERAIGAWTTNATLLGPGAIALARFQQANGDPAGADATLEQFVELGQQRGFAPQILARCAAMRAQLALARRELDVAARWVERSGPRLDGQLNYLQQAEYLAVARILIAQGRDAPQQLVSALHLLDRLLAAAEAGARMSSAIEILMLRALALQAGGEPAAALAGITRALAQAEPEGYIRLFVDEGAPMAALLREARAHGTAPAYVSKLLTAFPRTDSSGLWAELHVAHSSVLRPQPSALAETLSERELEVLRLIDEGHSNQVIADRLVVAIGTVKKHINNIYGKLAVQSRTQALARARELDLI